MGQMRLASGSHKTSRIAVRFTANTVRVRQSAPPQQKMRPSLRMRSRWPGFPPRLRPRRHQEFRHAGTRLAARLASASQAATLTEVRNLRRRGKRVRSPATCWKIPFRRLQPVICNALTYLPEQILRYRFVPMALASYLRVSGSTRVQRPSPSWRHASASRSPECTRSSPGSRSAPLSLSPPPPSPR